MDGLLTVLQILSAPLTSARRHEPRCVLWPYRLEPWNGRRLELNTAFTNGDGQHSMPRADRRAHGSSSAAWPTANTALGAVDPCRGGACARCALRPVFVLWQREAVRCAWKGMPCIGRTRSTAPTGLSTPGQAADGGETRRATGSTASLVVTASESGPGLEQPARQRAS